MNNEYAKYEHTKLMINEGAPNRGPLQIPIMSALHSLQLLSPYPAPCSKYAQDPNEKQINKQHMLRIKQHRNTTHYKPTM